MLATGLFKPLVPRRLPAAMFFALLPLLVCLAACSPNPKVAARTSALEGQIGKDAAASTPTAIDLTSREITDDRLAEFASQIELRELRLFDNPITDEGLARLKQLANLEILDLGFTKITDDGLQYVEGL